MSRSSKWLFLKKFIAQPSINASIIPSSQALARLMIQDIDWSIVDVVVEFGPGTGVFTRHIIKYAKPDAKIILLEFDQDYCQFLKDKFGDQVIIISWDVRKLEQLIKKHNLSVPNLIISWLPYFPFTWQEWTKLLQYLKTIIDQWCIMRWFSYSPWRFHKTYQILHPTLVDYTLSCIPPAFVYEMKK